MARIETTKTVCTISFVLLMTTFSFAFSFAASELESVDIGDASQNPGSMTIVDDSYTIVGSGSDIWGSADGFHFAYVDLSGDFAMTARQVSAKFEAEWGKAGLHARQDLSPGAPNAQAIITGGGAGGAQLTWRETEGGASSEFMDDAPGPWKDRESWLKLERVGNEFEGYVSEDGEKWLSLRSVTVVMKDPIVVGIAVCGFEGREASVVYDNLLVMRNGNQLFPLTVQPQGRLPILWGMLKGGPR